MNPEIEYVKFPFLEPVLNGLLKHSVQAGILVVLVLAAQWIFRRRITARWRFALWWLVLARLLLPFGPTSAVSVFNFLRPDVRLTVHYSKSAPSTDVPPGKISPTIPTAISPTQPASAASEKPYVTPTITSPQVNSEPVAAMMTPAKRVAPPALLPPRRFAEWNISEWDAFDYMIPVSMAVWLAGVLALGGVVLGQTFCFQRKLRLAVAPTTGNLRTLLADCQREFGVSRRIELLETEAVQSPALFGLFRLRLLLPRGLAGQFSARELRYIFLHELAHVKRGDLWLNWLVTGLQIVHWFNPLVWFGFARLRADRELACDELALLRAGDQAGTAYGETIVKLLENLNRPAAIPGLVGILEDRKQMRRRITMIANFRKPSRWSALTIFLVIALAAAALTDAQTNPPSSARIPIENNSNPVTAIQGKAKLSDDSYFADENKVDHGAQNAGVRPDLIGAVLAKDDSPLPVPATVFIATAAPKSGSSTFCPSCYADCAKQATTTANGDFKIAALDPQLTFRILAVAKGFKPQYVSNVDPVKGAPVKIELDPIEAADATPDRSLHGRVVDTKGAPIVGAVVEMKGIETRGGGGRWGLLPGIDPMAVTDEKGEFLIKAQKPFELMGVNISARTFAKKEFNQLASGATVHDLTLTEGATLTGRVLQNGQPLAGVSVGVSAQDRSTQNYLGHFEVATDVHGKFMFANLPSDTDYYIYGEMDSLKKFGVVSAQTIHVGKDGETTSAGDLIVTSGHRLAGRVVLADGQPLPPKTRLLLAREDVWDSMEITLDANGHFDTPGIPQEIINLSARTQGYHVSADNLSLDQLNPFRLVGRMKGDTTNLIFKLEKGPEPRPDYGNISYDYNDTRQRPLQGAEGGVDHSREWLVVGRVLDNETRLPIQNFRVTPGEVGDFQTEWNARKTVAGTNGVYQIYVSKRTAQPLLLAEAEGYLPVSLTPSFANTTNADFILQRGSGPAGTVLDPDGKPAAGVTLVLLNDDMNQASLDAGGGLMARGNQAVRQQTSGADGRFSFKPVFGMKSLAVASANGFAAVSLASFATNPVIQLAALGKISGTLKRTSGPGTNEDLDVAFAVDAKLPAGVNQINMSNHAVTDAQGRFSFEGVPPGHLQISYRKSLGPNQSGWQNNPLQTVDLKPGQSLNVDIATTDRPVMVEQAWQVPPSLKRIPGAQLKGVVLLPNGQPATDADVALQIKDEYLTLGQGTLKSNSGRERGYLVSVGSDGSFTLPLFEKAQSVIAINEVGFAQVSLEQLKKSPQITLQKWGAITGVLRVGRHLGTNEVVEISNPQPQGYFSLSKIGSATNPSPIMVQLPMYYSGAFKSATDDQGRFAINFVPPGKQKLWRRVPIGNNSWSQNDLATVLVTAGETTVADVGGSGRGVVGKVKFAADTDGNFTNGWLSASTPLPEAIEKMRNFKTDAERITFYQSPEVRAAFENQKHFSVAIAPDGSFHADEVLPGKYKIQFQRRRLDVKQTHFVFYTSVPELLDVPEAKASTDDSVVDWGTIELKEKDVTVPTPAQVK